MLKQPRESSGHCLSLPCSISLLRLAFHRMEPASDCRHYLTTFSLWTSQRYKPLTFNARDQPIYSQLPRSALFDRCPCGSRRPKGRVSASQPSSASASSIDTTANPPHFTFRPSACRQALVCLLTSAMPVSSPRKPRAITPREGSCRLERRKSRIDVSGLTAIFLAFQRGCNSVGRVQPCQG